MAKAPGITHWLPLPYGAFGEFVRDPLGFQLRAHGQFGDVFRFRLGPLVIHFLYHPDHVRRVLHDHQKNYLRGWHYRLLRRLLGENLVVSEGDYWLRQRRLAQPAFHRTRLAGYATVMADATAKMLARWRGTAAAVGTLDVGPEMSRVALEVAGRTLFDQDVSHEADAVGREFSEVSRYLQARFNKPFTTPPAWVPTPANRRFRRAVRALNDIVSGLIRQRRIEGRDHGDLLSMLMQARDEETGEAMTDDQLRSEALAFLMAGHETTATALTWAWVLLGTRPDLRRRLREEVTSAVGDRTPTVEDMPRLATTRLVLDETLRLYPPVWAVARQAVADDEIGGFRIPAGSTVVLCPFITHRHSAGWERPEEVDPDRFTAERSAGRPRGAYFPFLSGPHQCIGSEFAMLEMQLVVAMALQQFDLDLLPGEVIRPVASLALRPARPVRLAVREVRGAQ
ncbi:MAG: cytochrome P450 [Gemmataceae bacterium]